jgi:ribosome-binding protein aMBF1 (putative translation factor)
MDSERIEELKKKGFHVGSVDQFLELTPEESTMIEIRLQLVDLVKSRREKRGLTQTELAASMGSSQSRIAKLESGDTGITIDFMIRALLQLGITKKELGKAFEEESGLTV